MLAAYLQKRGEEPDLWLELEQLSVSSLEDQSDSDSECESSSDDEAPERYSRRDVRIKNEPTVKSTLRRQTTGSAPNLSGDCVSLIEPKVAGCSNARWSSTVHNRASKSKLALDLLDTTRSSSRPLNEKPRSSTSDLLSIKSNIGCDLTSGTANARWASIPKRCSDPRLPPFSLDVQRGSSGSLVTRDPTKRVSDLLSAQKSPPRSPCGKAKATSRWAAKSAVFGNRLPRHSLTQEMQKSSLSRNSAPDLLLLGHPNASSSEYRGTANARWSTPSYSPSIAQTTNSRPMLQRDSTRQTRGSVPILNTLGLKIVKVESTPKPTKNAEWTTSGTQLGSILPVNNTLLKPCFASLKPNITALKRGSSTESALHRSSDIQWSFSGDSGRKSQVSSKGDALGKGSNHSLTPHDITKRTSTGGACSHNDSVDSVFSFVADQWSTKKKLPRRNPKREASKLMQLEKEGDASSITSNNKILKSQDSEYSTAISTAKETIELISEAQELIRGRNKAVPSQATLNLCTLALSKPRRLSRGSSDSRLDKDEPQQCSALPCPLHQIPKQTERRSSLLNVSSHPQNQERIHSEECRLQLDDDGRGQLQKDVFGKSSLKRVSSDTILNIPTRRLSYISEDAMSSLQRSFTCDCSVGTENTPKLGLQRQLTVERTLAEAPFNLEHTLNPSRSNTPRQTPPTPPEVDLPNCALGYQHALPDSAKRFKNRRSSLEKMKPYRKSSMDMQGVGSFPSMNIQTYSSFHNKCQRKDSMDTVTSFDYSFDRSSCYFPFPQIRRASVGFSELSESAPSQEASGPNLAGPDFFIRYQRNHSMAMSECSELSVPDTTGKKGQRFSFALTECSDITMPSTLQNSALFESFTSDVFTMLSNHSTHQNQLESSKAEGPDDEDNLTKVIWQEKQEGRRYGISMPIRRSSLMLSDDCLPVTKLHEPTV